jgi:hypothetical protein
LNINSFEIIKVGINFNIDFEPAPISKKKEKRKKWKDRKSVKMCEIHSRQEARNKRKKER